MMFLSIFLHLFNTKETFKFSIERKNSKTSLVLNKHPDLCVWFKDHYAFIYTT